MKNLVLVATLLLSFSVMAAAQDVPAVEIFGGYSYLRCDTGTANLKCSLNGFNASASFNPNAYVGVVADFSGYNGKVSNQDARIASFMIGPKITIRKPKYTPFFQALIGISNIHVDMTENDFVMAFGGGLDINVHDRVAIRPFQTEYLTIKSGPDFTDNFRVSAGIVFKIGQR